MKNKFKISIIIPSFNDKRIERTVMSVLDQKFNRKDIQIIIMDGGSDKNKFASMLNFLEAECDILISEPDKGIFDGLNKGLDLADGELIFMIGSDDYLISDLAFEKAYKEFKLNDSHLISFEMFYVDSDNIIQRHWSLPKRLKRFPRFFQLPHFSTFISKNLLGETRFNIQSFISADFAFFKELISKDMKSKIINEPICCMTSGGQSSKNIKNIFLGNLQSLREFNSNPFLILGFIFNKIVSKAKHFLLIKLKREKYSRYQKNIFKKLSYFEINE
tara:strand:- start:5315 stop:6139 length:825 start_codon:yes stop_codon:yes gene_type:complete